MRQETKGHLLKEIALTPDRDLASKRIKGGGMNKKKDGSSDKFRELERKLRDAEGRCLERSERTPRANGVRREKSDPSEGLSEAKLPQTIQSLRAQLDRKDTV